MIRSFIAPESLETPLLDPPEESQMPMATSPEAEGHCSAVQALAICNGYICSAGGDAMIRVWKEACLSFVGYVRLSLLMVLSLTIWQAGS